MGKKKTFRVQRHNSFVPLYEAQKQKQESKRLVRRMSSTFQLKKSLSSIAPMSREKSLKDEHEQSFLNAQINKRLMSSDVRPQPFPDIQRLECLMQESTLR